VSSEAAVIVERRAIAAPSRRRAIPGAGLLSGAMVVSGMLTYAFHVLAARTLGPGAYGQIAALWATMFLAAIVLFRPLEQTTSRAIADRLARGEEARTVLRSVVLIAASVLLAIVTGGVVAWRPLTDGIFAGDATMTALLLAGTVAYGVAYVIRGLVGGIRWFKGYGLGLIADAFARLLVAAPLVVVASKTLAAGALLAAGLANAVVPLYIGRRYLRRGLQDGPGPRFRVGAALAFAAPACIIAASDQVLVNGAPLLVILAAHGHHTETAGVIFAATMLVRAPVYVFTGLAASLLPNLTLLQTANRGKRFRGVVVRMVALLLAIGAVIVAGTAAVGPQLMRILYGPAFEAGRTELVLLAFGVGCYLAAATFSQALLALDGAGHAAFGWGIAAVAFVGEFLILGGDELMRISIAFSTGMLGGAVLLCALLVERTARS
jgi:O-antigen/teichoic acid export membrane protein